MTPKHVNIDYTEWTDSADKSHEKLNEDVPSQARLTQRSAVLVKVDQFHGRKSQIQMHVFIELCYALERMITVSVRMWVLQGDYIVSENESPSWIAI